MAWAQPDFDDNHWSSSSVPGLWPKGGFPDNKQFGWYRLTLKFDMPADGGRQHLAKLGLGIGKVLSAYEVYAGGRLLGGVGKLPPLSEINYDREMVYQLPLSAIGEDGTLVIALRVWGGPDETLIYFNGGPYAGAYALGDYRALLSSTFDSQLPQLLVSVLFMGFGLYHLYLYRRNRQLDAFLWFGLMAINIGIYGLMLNQWKYAIDWPFLTFKKIEFGAIYVFPAICIQMFWTLLDLKINRWLRALQLLYVASAILVVGVPGHPILYQTLEYWQLSTLPLLIWAPWVALREARGGNREARILSLSLILFALTCVNDLLLSQGWVQTMRLVPYGFVAIILAMAVSLADRFTSMYSQLEQTVAQRTAELSNANRQLAEAVRRDPLTGLLNRRGFTGEAEAERERMLRTGRAFSVVLADVDNFKRVNDSSGHAHGDYVLQQLAIVLSDPVRSVDSVGRWGGEEFILLLPETELDGAGQMAEKLRKRVAEALFEFEGQCHSITMTFGIASQRQGESLDTCIARADSALYHGKKCGRNRVMLGSFGGLTLVN